MTTQDHPSKSEPVVLVTGGASGIGAAISRAFVDAGFAAHVCDVSQDAIDAFLEANPAVSATCASVDNEADMGRVFDDIEAQYGRLSVLVNCAGTAGPTAGIGEMDYAAWKACLAVNLDGSMLATRGAVPLLRRNNGGAIINISSTGGLFGYPNRSPYAAAKWGLIGLTKTWAMELGKDQIRVNAICPGSVEGPRIDAVIERDAKARGLKPAQVRELYLRQTSMRCFVSAEEVAALAVFLASEGARHISGQAIAVDGHTEGLGDCFA